MQNCSLIFNNKSVKINFYEDVPDSKIKYLPNEREDHVYRINGHVKIIKDGVQKLNIDFRIGDEIQTISLSKVLGFEVKNGMRLFCITKPANANMNVSYRFVSSSISNAPINRENCFVLDEIEDGANYEHIIMANSADRFDIVQLVARSSNLIDRRATYILE